MMYLLWTMYYAIWANRKVCLYSQLDYIIRFTNIQWRLIGCCEQHPTIIYCCLCLCYTYNVESCKSIIVKSWLVCNLKEINKKTWCLDWFVVVVICNRCSSYASPLANTNSQFIPKQQLRLQRYLAVGTISCFGGATVRCYQHILTRNLCSHAHQRTAA